MKDAIELPSYTEEFLAGLGPAALVELMRDDHDRVPRSVIDACARHGEDMTAAFQEMAERCWPESEASGDWWLRLHAAMVLGLIPSERAGLLLVRFMRRMGEADDADLQDWLSGYWPALFANKPDSDLAALRELCRDNKLDWYIRVNAVEPVVAAAERRGREALDEALAWVASIAADEEEDLEVRLSCGNTLLDFPRERHRALIDELEKREVGFGKHFSVEDIERAYAAGEDAPDWRGRENPWAFYTTEAIAERQQRWALEVNSEKDDEFEEGDLPFDELPLTYIRQMPKVGRNDLCPCGSGRKYKKCCLLKEEGQIG
jgi:hypothetical protein